MIRKILVASLLIVSCGKEDKNKDDSNHDFPLVKKSKNFEFIDKEKNIKVGTDDDVTYAESMKKGLAEAKSWGVSLKSDYSPNLPEIAIDEAFTIKSDAPTHDKLKSTLDGVLSRMKDRCPVFSEKRRWKPVKLEFIKSDDHLRWGGQLQSDMTKWRQDYKEHVATFGPYFGRNDEKVVLWHDNLKSFKDATGIDPWCYKMPSITQSSLIFFENKYEIDVTLSHEIAHWFIGSLFNENGRVDLQTAYFAEVLAKWISAICYVSNFENAAQLKEQTDREEKESPQKLWPVHNVVSSNNSCFEIRNDELPKNNRATYTHSIGMDCGLGGFLASKVYYDGKLDSKYLMKVTVDSIIEMTGKKLTCRSDDSSCYGLSTEYNDKNIISDIQRPYVYTLVEFIFRLEPKIEIPEKAHPMWERYKEVITEIEQ